MKKYLQEKNQQKEKLIFVNLWSERGEHLSFAIHDFAADQSIKVNTIIGFVIVDILIAIACFFIVKQNPKSIWYVPIICNAYSIIGVIGNPPLLWETSMGISFLCGWALSIIASIIGALIGKRTTISDIPYSPNNLSEG